MFKTMKGFGDPLQYSVFFCTLSASEKIVMVSKVLEVMNCNEDRFMIVKIGPEDTSLSKSFEFFGKRKPLEHSSCIII